MISIFFFFNDTATTEIYTLSLHDALPIYFIRGREMSASWNTRLSARWPSKRLKQSNLSDCLTRSQITADRKSTRLNSSHLVISYAVFCLKKKKQTPATRNGPRNSSFAKAH